MNGIINVLKPADMTSHDVVGMLRRITRIKKIGHTGTLDPNAAGVLPVCIGKATRVAEYFNDSEITKTYRAELALGKKTDTQDAYGEVIAESADVSGITEHDVHEAYKAFTGKIEQIPPMFSAIRHNGRRLYELARQGIEVERKKREIEIFRIDPVYSIGNRHMFDVDCSSGTYVRTLCSDIAEHLGCHGHMSFLLRTRVGNFQLEDALTLEEIESLSQSNQLEERLLPLDYPLGHYKEIVLEDRHYGPITNGVKIKVEGGLEDGIYRVYCADKFIGLGVIESGIVKMRKVLL